jgi:histidyl-tRNA synthetase
MLQARPFRGMRDILPGEHEIRLAAMDAIRTTYQSHGFLEIETPILETLEALAASGAGENTKLMFKVLKRGERLDLASAASEDDLADAGLRFDLTVPLARFYAVNQSKLPKPFAAMQIGPAFRAERPQRGRLRQFVQADADILGEASWLAEVQLLVAATAALHRLGLEGFQLRINDRRAVEQVLAFLEIQRDAWRGVLVALDKLDKEPPAKVHAEIVALGVDDSRADRLLSTLGELVEGDETLASLADLGVSDEVVEHLSRIESHVRSSVRDTEVIVDPLIVRGIDYYTSTVFEILHPRWSTSIGGGGRYDGLLGRFGVEEPACGISIGFERVLALVAELGVRIGEPRRRLTLIFDPSTEVAEALRRARHFRREGYLVTLLAHDHTARSPMKRLALAAEELKAEGSPDSFWHFTIGVDDEPRLLMH